MILVLLGTQNNSFKRLLQKIDELIEKGVINETVVVQAGHTKYESGKMKILNLMAKEELEELQNKADLIISHGGVGSIISSVLKNKKVIAIPRLHQYGEHVNDHQKDIVQLFNDKRLYYWNTTSWRIRTSNFKSPRLYSKKISTK